jgi:hypothetical protein
MGFFQYTDILEVTIARKVLPHPALKTKEN